MSQQSPLPSALGNPELRAGNPKYYAQLGLPMLDKYKMKQVQRWEAKIIALAGNLYYEG